MSAIHASAEDYLETILILHNRKGMVRSIDIANELGYYWTSEPSEEKGFAHHLFFNDGGRWIDQFNRYLGVQIRPVAK